MPKEKRESEGKKKGKEEEKKVATDSSTVPWPNDPLRLWAGGSSGSASQIKGWWTCLTFVGREDAMDRESRAGVEEKGRRLSAWSMVGGCGERKRSYMVTQGYNIWAV